MDSSRQAAMQPRTGQARDASSAIRWGGAGLALSAALFVVTIVLYVAVYGQPEGTGPGGEVMLGDKAVHVLAKWEFISRIWLVESIACLLMAVSALVLAGRAPSGPAWLPSRAAWTAVGVGAVVQSPMYALMLGGYPAAAGGYQASPVLFELVQGAATFLFYLGNAAVYFGLGGAFLAEVTAGGLLPRWLALCGAIVCLAVAALLVGLLSGVGTMLFAAPGALAGFVLAAWLGVLIFRQG